MTPSAPRDSKGTWRPWRLGGQVTFLHPDGTERWWRWGGAEAKRKNRCQTSCNTVIMVSKREISEGTLMKAAFNIGLGEFEIREVPTPEPAPGEALVRVKACGICGSDKHEFSRQPRPPRIAGHELAGVVETDAGGSGCRPRAGGRLVFWQQLHHRRREDPVRGSRHHQARH